MSGISDTWRHKEKYKLQQNILQGVVVLSGFTIVCPLVEETMLSLLTLKVLITTAADDIHKYFFIVFQGK